MLALIRLAEKHYAHWPPKQTKEHKYEYFRRGKRQKRTQTIKCSVHVQVQTQINNESTVCVHSGLKCDDLSSTCTEHFITQLAVYYFDLL